MKKTGGAGPGDRLSNGAKVGGGGEGGGGGGSVVVVVVVVAFGLAPPIFTIPLYAPPDPPDPPNLSGVCLYLSS